MIGAGNATGRFMFQPLGNETVKQAMLSQNMRRNNPETESLKGLADLVLLRNKVRNSPETKSDPAVLPIAQLETEKPFDPDAYQERAAIMEANGIPREWAEGYATFCTMPRPAAYAPECWWQIVDDGGYFLDRWGRSAAALGWRAVDCFGVNPDAPEARYDGMGLVPLLAGRHVCAITVDTARIDCGKGRALTFYRQNMDAGAVALWKLGEA